MSEPTNTIAPCRPRTHDTRCRKGSSTSRNETYAIAADTTILTVRSTSPSRPVRSGVSTTYTGQCQR